MEEKEFIIGVLEDRIKCKRKIMKSSHLLPHMEKELMEDINRTQKAVEFVKNGGVCNE